MDVFDLWLPILVSAIVVFVASSLAWMVLPHHKADIKVLPDEKSLADHITKIDIAPGTYMWPGSASPEEMKSEEYKARYERGPWGSINVLGAKPNFGLNLVLVFLVYLVISVFVAYITAEARQAGADFMAVMQVAGSVAILGYCAGGLPGAIFMGKPGRFVLTDFIDALVYAVITGVIFAVMWPSAETMVPLPG